MSSQHLFSENIQDFRLRTTPYGQSLVGHTISWSDPTPGSEQVLYKRHGLPLGKGQYGEIYLEQAQNPTERAPKVRAVKEVNKAFSVQHKIDWKREIEALAILSQPQVSQNECCETTSMLTKRQYKPFFVGFFGWYEDKDVIYLAMEFFDLKDLSEHLMDIVDEEEIRMIARQLTQGLKIMHEHKIVHRDLKPKVCPNETNA
jgi:serine/threonine protein kinase